MPTDKELRDAAVAKFQSELGHLRLTTRGLKSFSAPLSSEWGKALKDREDGLALLAQIGGAVPVPSPVGTGGKHVSSVHQQDYLPSVMQYGKGDLFFCGEWAAKEAAATLSIPVYAYCSAVNARDSFFTGLTPAFVRNAGWALKDANGNELHVAGWGDTDVAGDIGNAAYQQAWANKVIAQHRDTDGAQGTFIDDLAQSPHIISGIPAKYPNQPTWRAAMESFVRAVGPKLKAAGLKVMLNTGAWYPGSPNFDNGLGSIDWATTLGPFGTSAMIENGYQTIDGSDTIRVMGPNWNQQWDKWGQVITAIEAAGVDYIGLAHAPGGDSPEALYQKASMMLYMNRPGSSCMFNCNNSGDTSPFGAKVSADLGAAKGAPTLSGGVWRRNFERGHVWVNPWNQTADIVPA